MQETQVPSLGGEYTLEKKWQPTPVFLPGKSHEQRSLAGYSPWGHKRVRHDLVTKQNNEWKRAKFQYIAFVSSRVLTRDVAKTSENFAGETLKSQVQREI